MFFGLLQDSFFFVCVLTMKPMLLRKHLLLLLSMLLFSILMGITVWKEGFEQQQQQPPNDPSSQPGGLPTPAPLAAACPPCAQTCPPCPACARCPEPAFECKKVPNYRAMSTDGVLPAPVLNDFSSFGM